MKKTLYLVRHAKSSWKDSSLDDIDRPLNERGLRDAPFMARLLATEEQKPDLILSSPAVRAHTTAKYFAEALGIPKDDIVIDPQLYLASEEYVLQKINATPDEVDTLLMFGHNPTYTYLATLFHNEYIDNVPTAAIVKIVGEVDSWRAFVPDTAQFVKMRYPKEYFS